MAVEIDETGFTEFANSIDLEQYLSQVATTVTAAAATYTGHFTGELHDSMQWAIKNDEGSKVALLGSGTVDGSTVGQAALNWYGHKDPAGIKVREDYPRWTPDHEVKDHPTHPYEKALKELHIEFTHNPEWEAFATESRSQRGSGS